METWLDIWSEDFVPSGYRMARRKRVARAANPISRGNLDQNEARQTCRTMRRNFQRGWWDRGCVKTGIEAKEKSILSSRKSENSFYLFPPFVPFFPRFSFLLPWSFLHDADVIIKIAKGPSFFFFLSSRMKTRKKASMLI